MSIDVQEKLDRQADIDIGYDYDFEHWWGRFERVVWGIFTLLMIAGILGFFGRGPLDKVSQTYPDGTTVQYDRVVRFKSPSVVIFTIPAKNGVATIEASKNVAEKLGLQSLVPPASRYFGSWQVGPVRYEVPSADTRVFVQVVMQPASLGPVTATYRINNQETVKTKQFILP